MNKKPHRFAHSYQRRCVFNKRKKKKKEIKEIKENKEKKKKQRKKKKEKEETKTIRNKANTYKSRARLTDLK